MSGSIRAEQRALCSCGLKYKQVKEFGYSVPKCLKCDTYPKKLRVSRYLPTLEGKGDKIDIRWSHTGERLNNVWDAIAVMKLIDKEIQEGSFDPTKYASKKAADQLKFKYFIEKKYLVREKKRFDADEIGHHTYRKKVGTYRNHLSFFNEMDIRAITGGNVREFYELFPGGQRTKDLVIGELKVILNYAEALGFGVCPPMPKAKRVKKRNVENFLLDGEQEKIFKEIENPLYLAMIKCCFFYALRPCEVRALKWSDIDYAQGVITISRHFSGNVLRDGRKSNDELHYLPIIPEFLEAISFMPPSIVKNNYVFIGKNGGAVGETVLPKAWHKARDKAGIPYTQLYEGTKHSRLSILMRSGYSDAEILMISGHTNVKTMKRYAQLKKKDRVALAREVLR